MLQLILYLVSNYHTDNYVKWLMDNTYIHIMPSMNPDGFEISQPNQCNSAQGRSVSSLVHLLTRLGILHCCKTEMLNSRYNAKGFDLNRNFPDYFKQNTGEIQPETKAVMDWVHNIQFTLSLNLHGGALVASYPFDNTPNSSK